MADAQALRRAIQNLLNNAIKYGAEQRWIKLRASVQWGKRVREVRISVQDRGIGIAPADLPHIFEPFYRGRDVITSEIRGTGLGLNLVEQIIEAHGGRVTVESVQGQGSTFTLHLPIAPTAEGVQPAISWFGDT
jgi:signal transduction histidine kinase